MTSRATSVTVTTFDAASWSSDDNRWTVRATRTDTGESVTLSANFLWMCQGYYRHAEGYTPEWPGMERFQGRDRASPDVARGPGLPRQRGHRHRFGRDRGDAGAGDRRRRLARDDPPALADLLLHRRESQPPGRPPARTRGPRGVGPRHRATREPLQPARADATRARGARVRQGGPHRSRCAPRLPPGFDVETHFTPRYMPWRQRIAFLPDGDLFKVISAGPGVDGHRRDRDLHRNAASR